MTTLKIEQVSRTFPARHGNAPTRALEPTDLTIEACEPLRIVGDLEASPRRIAKRLRLHGRGAHQAGNQQCGERNNAQSLHIYPRIAHALVPARLYSPIA